eukprot:CAMPEP_0175001384 /NCGR_PEP_ID=MMETSP0005-20121125/3102_1 /TAXON_ID=420556 /ORGANISM="Ochromonas sp., Strain CCMP1393" /LENGTH=575 /DNA_ID=CAMNT_0016256261 /DNA_START=1481 /DNA_END=3205 /DNA_ORIENTATION=-
MLWQSSLILISLSTLSHISATLNARAWKSNSEFPREIDYPETQLLTSKPNTAIGFTGGGSRAYTAAIGYLAALRDLNLLKNVRYIGGISGGSWATTAFTYVQNVTDDDVFLGEIVYPQDIRYRELQEVDPACARSLPDKELTLIAVQALAEGLVHSIADSWAYAVSKVYLEPLNISPNTRFSWNKEVVDDIKARNPQLVDETFLTPYTSERPFPIIGTAIVGPYEGAPYVPKTQNMSYMEITPLYTGHMKNLDVEYTYRAGEGREKNKVHTFHVGGAIESYAFTRVADPSSATGAAPKQGLEASATTELVEVPEPKTFLDLSYTAGASSYAPGALFESVAIPAVAEGLSMTFDYWSPSEVPPSSSTPPTSTTMMYTDGGCYENIPLISFIQRRVPKIVLFYSAVMPLMPLDKYNASSDVFTGEQVTDDLAAFFGVFAPPGSQPRWENRSYEIENNQVFAQDDYARVITALQVAQQEGHGIIASFNLTTVQNDWWGVPAGLDFEITFTYLGRLREWESQLNAEMYKLAVPTQSEADTQNLGVDIKHGPFAHFPHYPTKGGGVNAHQANLLADLTGW